MTARGTSIAIDLDRDRLMAVAATVTGSRVIVRSWLRARRPERVDPADARAVGAWIADELRQANMRGPVVLAVHRGEVVLKRITLPRGERDAEEDLAGMVRLQMARQMTVPLQGTAVDYMRISQDARFGEVGEGGAAGAVTVLAGALPGDRLAWLQSMAAAGRLRVVRIGLRACGAATLMAEGCRGRSGPVLGIVPGPSTTELVVVAEGRLVFARAVDAGFPESGAELDAYTEKVVVEAKRTWMSYRVGRDSAEVEAVVIEGDGPLAEAVGGRCAAALEMPLVVVKPPEAIEFPARMPELDRCLAAPLAGLLAERAIGEATLDFANPRRVPDRAAQFRQRVLLAVLLGILTVGGLYVAATIELGRLESRVEAARERQANLKEQHERMLLQEARLRHIEAWMEPRIEWLAHIGWLSAALPDPREAQLDELRGDMKGGVDFATPDRRDYTRGAYSPWQEAKLSLAGRVSRRDVANELRGRLMSSEAYRVDNTGPDLPDRFDYHLLTEATTPERERRGGPGRLETPPSGDDGPESGAGAEGRP